MFIIRIKAIDQGVYMGKCIRKSLIGTKDKSSKLLNNYIGVRKIEGADVYWHDESGTLFVLTSQEWKDYLLDNVKINSKPQN
jgi:hypothetical protein